MFRYRIHLAVFVVGLAAVLWVAIRYAATNPLALVVALLIGACYVTGALELYRYQQATDTLIAAVAELDATPPHLGAWLERLHPSLRGAVRLRVEGERAGLPGPALTPYLVGLLVLLGMLGTLLGMAATLRGTGAALDSATDLQAVRASLAAPVRGLGFAFGTSIAGVATSAMLGLLSALCRRERIKAAQQLDAKIATVLRVFSPAHQREETFRLMQRQAEAMPALLDGLHTLMGALEQHSAATSERQLASQQQFHAKTELVYARLANSVEQSLRQSVGEHARAVGAAIEPVVETTLASLARDTTALHERVAQATQQQMEGLSRGFASTAEHVAGTWTGALDAQRASNDALAERMSATLERFAANADTRTAKLLDDVASQLAASAASLSQSWSGALAQHAQTHDGLAVRHEAAMKAVSQSWSDALAQHVQTHDALATRHEAATAAALQSWSDALAQHARTHDALATRQEAAMSAAAATFETATGAAAERIESHTASLVERVDASHAALQAQFVAADEKRLAAWAASLDETASALSREWAEAGTQHAARQQQICDTLAATAREIAERAQAQARGTLDEIARLVSAASEAPKAAADVIGELRKSLSESMVRDTAMLEERTRLLQTLETLLDAVNHASTEQRAAIDGLVSSSATLLERVGEQFSGTVETEAHKLDIAAAQVATSAIEMASMGDAFGTAVASFSEANGKLMTHLERIERALDKSLARSDEQLAYYVAQAREVIDLSVMSQKQIMEDLQHLAGARAS
ncbi:DUF802 domain-containing protein [Paraburkholderia sp. SOS3]|uniref:DUF802 domain-containing protein n=1 Tax=Paraburkholderia sp. SOS3 TaxID=1926494 RepID=UPI0009476AC6|nr:DUF802 domain-containing protein [Paraburkholderia sp. SOS3]APR35957.1 DUF802 domain-containing protein [Paraburkholderia sp. SOS3]